MGRQVVIIDDEPDFCYLMAGICLREGFRPRCVHTLREAMALKITELDLLFLDNSLPDGLGIKHLPALKGHLNPRKVVLISGEGVTVSQNEYWENGFDLFLSKPVRILDVKRILSMSILPV